MNPVYDILGFKMRLNWKETHHGYYGIVLMIIGAILFSLGGVILKWIGAIIFLFGLYLFYDDFLLQHHRQVDDPDYHSPVHVWYVEELYTFGWIKKLNWLLDKLLG